MQRALEERRSPLVAPRPSRSSRVLLLDRCRGSVLGGVLLVNMLVFAGDASAGWSHTLGDRTVVWIREAFFNGKCYEVFALVFGYSMAVQLRGIGTVPHRRRVVKRRLLVIGALGVAHGLTLYRFDILVAYGVLGWIAYRCRRASTGALLAAALALLLAWSWELWFSGFAVADLGLHRVPTADAIAKYQHGSLAELLALHAHNYWFNLATEAFMQWPSILALMLVGVVAERFDVGRRLVEQPRLRRRVMALGAAATLVNVAAAVPALADGRVWLGFAATLCVPAQSIGYVALVAWWCSAVPASLVDALGRMSLTAYLAQSVVCAVTFYGFGLGLAHLFSPVAQVAFSGVVYVAQVILAQRWSRHHSRGPIESVVHRLSEGSPMAASLLAPAVE